MTDKEALDIAVARTGHDRYRALCDPDHPNYDPAQIHNVRKIAGEGIFTPSSSGVRRRNVSSAKHRLVLSNLKKCKYLDSLCGCQWGTCKNEKHERFGKEVGHRDCFSCTLMEVADGSGSG